MNQTKFLKVHLATGSRAIQLEFFQKSSHVKIRKLNDFWLLKEYLDFWLEENQNKTMRYRPKTKLYQDESNPKLKTLNLVVDLKTKFKVIE